MLHQFKCGGFFSNSWIIFASDHGDMAGEHNIAFKGPYFYEGVLRVPLIVVPPLTRFVGADRGGLFRHDLQPGRRSGLCSLIDVPPTILDLGGVTAPSNFSGASLLPMVRGEAKRTHAAVFAEWHRPPARMVRTERHKYTHYLNGEDALYDLAEDPHETVNLARSEAHADLKADLAARIRKHIADTRDPFDDLDRHEFIFNPSPHHRLGTNEAR
jgi:arylsulfatase A-like enzyme